jgi:hypothetical protein
LQRARLAAEGRPTLEGTGGALAPATMSQRARYRAASEAFGRAAANLNQSGETRTEAHLEHRGRALASFIGNSVRLDATPPQVTFDPRDENTEAVEAYADVANLCGVIGVVTARPDDPNVLGDNPSARTKS